MSKSNIVKVEREIHHQLCELINRVSEVLSGASSASLDVAEKIVAIALAYNDGRSTPISVLSRQCSLSRGTINRAISTLERKGFIRRTRRHNVDGGNAPNAYELIFSIRQIEQGSANEDHGADGSDSTDDSRSNIGGVAQ